VYILPIYVSFLLIPLHRCGGDCRTRELYILGWLALCHIYYMYCLPICFCECKLFMVIGGLFLCHFVSALKCFRFCVVMSVRCLLGWFCLWCQAYKSLYLTRVIKAYILYYILVLVEFHCFILHLNL